MTVARDKGQAAAKNGTPVADDATVAERVRRAMGDLSPQERRVARTLLADYPRAALGSSPEVATRAGVSPPTVVRFARSLGFAGYPDLQASVVAELSERQASPLSQYVEHTGTEGHWSERGLATANAEIAGSLSRIPREELDRAVTLLADPKLNVGAFGGRFSGMIASYLLAHLQQIRARVSFDGVGTSGVNDIVDAGRRSVFVVYDFRRYQASTVARAQLLAESGARLVCITDPWLSPVSRVSDVVLPTSVASASPFDSGAAAFVLTELLIAGTMERVGSRRCRGCGAGTSSARPRCSATCRCRPSPFAPNRREFLAAEPSRIVQFGV